MAPSSEEGPDAKKAKIETEDGPTSLQSLKYSNDGGRNPKLSVLDQLKIPQEKVYIDITNVEEAFNVIRTMQIRGAPLIAIVALLGLSVDLLTNSDTIQELDALEKQEISNGKEKEVEIEAEAGTAKEDNNNIDKKILELIQKKMEYLKSSRPTAVNLSNALQEVDDSMKRAMTTTKDESSASVRERLTMAVLEYSEFMLKRDVSDNKAIGKFGAEAILAKTKKDKVNMVTICNTGSLATAGYGTALGVARRLQETGNLESITALETRPYNQGSRLTAFEIMEEKMPGGRLICDSAAGALMQTKQVDGVVVGADRVCANGDTANKIGTYNLSIIAAFHNVPFYVAAPITSLDTSLESGDAIPIEERSSEELISSSNAPEGMNCWNPAFDVTPAKNITGIVTEKGVIEPDANGKIDVKAFL